MKKLGLKETTHSYYCSDSNYYSIKAYMSYESWKKFVDDWDPLEMDIDMNYIFRFDIKKYDDENDYLLQLFIMHQRKGLFRCVTIKNIQKENMKEITSLLQLHYNYHKKIWNEFENKKGETL